MAAPPGTVPPPTRATPLDVVVVGCGPVGVTLAGLLAGRGLAVAAVDRETELFPLPRAAHLDAEIMRVLQELGCADTVGPATVPLDGMDFLTADREVLLSMRSDPEHPAGWPASVLFHQPGLETAMRAAAVVRGAQLRLGVAVDTVDERHDGVLVTLADGTVLTAPIVVACDGARSSVRRALGVTMDDLGFEEPWLVVDLVLRDGTPRPTTVAYQVCDPARPHTLVPMPPPRFRFEFMLLPGEEAADVDNPARIRALLSAWLDPDGVEVERSAVYTFHGLLAHDWRRGRVLLAGDAAHQMPPFLGQGMCSGIRDAANLAWKLERVLRHGAPLTLLDTYQAEREPHVRAIVEAAVGFGRLICTTDAATAAERDRAMLAARAAGGGRAAGSNRMPLAPGPLVGDGGGSPVRQVVLGDGRRLDDAIGRGFAVLRRHTATGDEATARWVAFGATVLDGDREPAVLGALDALDADAAVVRPDRYVLAAGATVPAPTSAAADLLGG